VADVDKLCGVVANKAPKPGEIKVKSEKNLGYFRSGFLEKSATA